MTEKTEKCAREIEALLKERNLFIDGSELRDILGEEFEKVGGDATCKVTPVDSSVSQSNAAPTVQSAGAAALWQKLMDQYGDGAEWESCIALLEKALQTETEVIVQKYQALVDKLTAQLDGQDEDHAKYVEWATKELKAQIADRKRLVEELLDAKKKHYTDYREYCGLVGQNESLRRQIDVLERKLAER